jgi:S-adenosylmethionine:tRNA ribosyltransferase-isomerase
MGDNRVKIQDLQFDRPAELVATRPPQLRGIARDEVRLLVSDDRSHRHAQFTELVDYLCPGDLLVVNHSATLPASLPARGAVGQFILNLSTHYGNGLWLNEPRWSSSQPGPLPLKSGERIEVAGLPARLVAPYPGLPELWFLQIEGDVLTAMAAYGQPIRYGYVDEAYPLEYYQTIFATTPGSAEMPSAGYPFTKRVLKSLRTRGVDIAGIILHTGVSSMMVETEDVEAHPLYPEPFEVSVVTAQAVNRARAQGQRIIAVGTTVARALESAWDGHQVKPSKGYTRLFIHPHRGVHVIDGLITGLHDPVTSHLALLYAVARQDVIRSAYQEAVEQGYLWHEFGDSHLILGDRAAETILKPISATRTVFGWN